MVFGLNVRSGNAMAYDGNASALQGLARGIAALAPAEHIRFYLDKPPLFATFRTEGWREAVVLRPWRGMNRILYKLHLEPWYEVRLQVELWCRRPDAYFQVGQEPIPRHVPCPAVFLIHDLAFLLPEANKYFDAATKERLAHWTERAVHQADRLVAVSQSCKNDLVTHYGFPAERIAVAHHGFDPETFRPLSAEVARAQLQGHYPVESPYILFIGRIQPRKNLVRLIRAFHAARQRGLPHALLVAGVPGWEWTEPYQVAEKLGLSGVVHFLGGVPHAQLPLLLNGADLLALPSIHEGFGMPALEAMACGVPVLASESGALPEVVGDAGVLVNPLDETHICEGLLKLGLDKEFRQHMAERALARSQQFSWERSARVVLDTLRKAAARP